MLILIGVVPSTVHLDSFSDFEKAVALGCSGNAFHVVAGELTASHAGAETRTTASAWKPHAEQLLHPCVRREANPILHGLEAGADHHW